MPYFILALTFGAMGLSFHEYFTPDTSTNTITRISIDVLWLPLLERFSKELIICNLSDENVFS